MDLIALKNAERVNWMRKRHAFLNNLVKSHTSLDDFARDKIPNTDGQLTISEVALWQDDCCVNTYLSIFNLLISDGTNEDILTIIHDYP
jgi:hypothetical protein